MREPLRDRERLEHIITAADNIARYLAETDWDEGEKNAVVIKETAVHKNLVQTATRMKQRGYDTDEICKITGLPREEIDRL